MRVELELEGGKAAAGIAVADKPLVNYMPLFRSSDGQVTTGFDMTSLEHLGLRGPRPRDTARDIGHHSFVTATVAATSIRGAAGHWGMDDLIGERREPP